MPYRKPFPVPEYNCDSGGKLKLSMVMRYMQATSGEQLDTLGYTYEYLFAENLVFLLSQTCIKIYEMPRAGQEIVVGTTATGTKGVRFLRDFIVEDTVGNRLIDAHTLWVLVDSLSRKILRPSAFSHNIPIKESLLGAGMSALAIPKVDAPNWDTQWNQRVGYSLIDVNHHINNSVYADFVCDSLPMEALTARGLDSVVIAFQNEARQGDMLAIQATAPAAQEAAGYLVRGIKEDGSSCFEAFAVLK